MNIHFLGSSASEGIPNPFCRCNLCQKARALGGKDVRSHSSVLINNELLIDMAPTFSYQLLREGLDATTISTLLFTHTHPDHFNVGELFSRMEGYAFGIDLPLAVMGNDRAISACVATLPGFSPQRFAPRCLAPFITVEYAGYQITPLLANHSPWELCYLYYIEKEGLALFYGHDSGWFPEPTWRWLAQKNIDLAVLECTYGFSGKTRTDNHMSIDTAFAARRELYRLGCLHPESQVVLSHISHSSGLTHEEMVTACAPEGIQVAWDGLSINMESRSCANGF